jgi:hypothetical protein
MDRIMQYAINRRAWGSLSLAKGPSARSVAAHIGIAVGCALGALIVRTAIETIEPGAAQLIVALPAVVLAGALAGVWPAIVTALLAGIGIEFLFAWSDFTAWPPLSGGQAHFLFYLAACASVLWPTARLRRSTAMAAAAEARLREVLRQVPAAVAILEAPRGNLLLRSSLSTSILGHDPASMPTAASTCPATIPSPAPWMARSSSPNRSATIIRMGSRSILKCMQGRCAAATAKSSRRWVWPSTFPTGGTPSGGCAKANCAIANCPKA